jgi:hypothetical protein
VVSKTRLVAQHASAARRASNRDASKAAVGGRRSESTRIPRAGHGHGPPE